MSSMSKTNNQRSQANYKPYQGDMSQITHAGAFLLENS
jgi:hypothetical protein